MTILDVYRYFPPKCQKRECDHDQGRCIRYRSRQCLSGECTHASRGLMCGVNYELAPPRPQPAPVDVTTQPYGCKVMRADGNEWTFATMYQTQPEEGGPLTPIGVAQRAAASVRTGHSYYGPLKVFIWAHRGDEEHYRQPVPRNALRYDFPAQPELRPERPTLRVAD